MSSILITGASGFVGQHLIRQCLADLPNVSIHACMYQTPVAFPESVKTYVVDLLDNVHTASIVATVKPTVLIHLAGQSNVSRSYIEPVITYQQNTLTTLNLLEACRQTSPSTTFFLVSSGDVYGGAATKGILTENTLPEPLNFYSTSKLGAEALASAYGRDFGVKSIILRPFNHIGIGLGHQTAISQFAEQIVNLEKQNSPGQLSVGNLETERDFLWVKDVVKAYIALYKIHESLLPGDIYNICSGKTRRISDILDTLLNMTSAVVDVTVDPTKVRQRDINQLKASNEKFRLRCPDWQPSMDLDVALADILNYYRSRTVDNSV